MDEDTLISLNHKGKLETFDLSLNVAEKVEIQSSASPKRLLKQDSSSLGESDNQELDRQMTWSENSDILFIANQNNSINLFEKTTDTDFKLVKTETPMVNNSIKDLHAYSFKGRDYLFILSDSKLYVHTVLDRGMGFPDNEEAYIYSLSSDSDEVTSFTILEIEEKTYLFVLTTKSIKMLEIVF